MNTFPNLTDNDLCKALDLVRQYDPRGVRGWLATAYMAELDRRIHAIVPELYWTVNLGDDK